MVKVSSLVVGGRAVGLLSRLNLRPIGAMPGDKVITRYLIIERD